jgi:CRP-like cAMP-binding protein
MSASSSASGGDGGKPRDDRDEVGGLGAPAASAAAGGVAVMGMALGALAGESAALHGLWVEVNALAAPVVLGAHALVDGRPHWSTVMTTEPSVVLELRPAAYARMCRQMPAAAAGLAALGSLAQPHQLVAAVPCLVTLFADASRHGLVSTDAHQLLGSLAALFRPLVLAPGEALFTEDDVGDAAYVVVQGTLGVSARASSTGTHNLLAAFGRGSCVGDTALVAPCARATRTVALTSCLLLRLSHAALHATLAHRPRLWRAVRNAAVWRDASQLCRLPLLSHLVGGEGEAARLAPLADLFTATVLAGGAPRPSIPAPLNAAAAAAIGTGSASLLDAVQLTHDCLEGEGAAHLMLITHGCVEVAAAHGGPATAVLSAGDWIGASTLYTSRHAAECALVTPCAPSTGGSVASVAAGAAPDAADRGDPGSAVATATGISAGEDGPPVATASPTAGSVSGSVTGRSSLAGGTAAVAPAAVLLTLSRAQLDAFITTLPSGGKRLSAWRHASQAAAAAAAAAAATAAVPARAELPVPVLVAGGGMATSGSAGRATVAPTGGAAVPV